MAITIDKKRLLPIRRDGQIAQGVGFPTTGGVGIITGGASDLYYLKTALDSGQLDNRYYTETELNAGQLNNLYYTETEINTWRSNLFGTDNQIPYANAGGDNFDYSANLTFDGTKLGIGVASPGETLEVNHATAPKIRFGRGASYYWDIGHTASNFQIESQTGGVIMTLEHDGNVGIGQTNPAQLLHLDSASTVIRFDHSTTNFGYVGRAQSIITGGGNDELGIRSTTDILFSSGLSEKMRISSTGNVGIGTTSPGSYRLYVSGDLGLQVYHSGATAQIMVHEDAGTHDSKLRIRRGADDWYIGMMGDNDLSFTYETSEHMIIKAATGNTQHPSFTSGWQGTNWRIKADGEAEFEKMFIRGGLTVNELILNQLRYQDGGLIIGAGGGKVKTVHVSTPGSEQLEFEDPQGNSIVPFTVGAIVLMQRFDINSTTIIKQIVRQVASVTSQVLTLTTTTGWLVGDDTGIFAVGDEVVAIGHVSDGNLDSSLYMSAVDQHNPFLRVFDGVNSYAKWSLGDESAVKLQIGNLESLAGHDIVPATPGYGLYSTNVYLSGKIVTGGDEHSTDDWSTTGITLAADGSIHTPNFYVNVGGEIGLRQVEHVLFKLEGNAGIKISGYNIWENEYDSDLGTVNINKTGYNGGTTKYRNTQVLDGKNHAMTKWSGVDEKIYHYNDTNISKTLTVYNAEGTASVGIGTASPISILHVFESRTATSGSKYGIRSAITSDPSGATTAYDYGAYFNVDRKSTNSYNGGYLYAFLSQADNSGSGVPVAIYGGALQTRLSGTGNVTTAYGIYTRHFNSGTGTLATLYGLYLATAYVGAGAITTRYGVYQQDSTAINYFAGKLHSALGRIPANKIHGTNVTLNTIFDALAPSVPNTNDEIILNGSYEHGGVLAVFNYAKRTDSTNISMYYVNTNGLASILGVTDGSGTTVDAISISW